MSENVFQSMPEIPAEDIQWCKDNFFDNYLFFKKLKDGIREYTCSACGAKFRRGKNVPQRTKTSNDYHLDSARVSDYCECPNCHKVLQVKNANHCRFSNLYQEHCYLFFDYANPNEVWYRGVLFSKKFDVDILTPRVEEWECFRYKLTPGEATMWKKHSYDGDFYKEMVSEAFMWNYGLNCEKHAFSFYFIGGKSLKDTFLKYNEFYTYIQHAFYNGGSEIKYLCWYARHPQIEMLAKIGQFEIIDQMVFYNTDNSRLLNWKAKTPWDLMRLTHSEYKEYLKRGSNLDLLKTYHRIKGSGVKDFNKAQYVNDFFKSSWGFQINHAAVVSVNAMAKREGKTAYDAVKYFEKTSRDSVGACHHCPGITAREAYNLWEDYIEMLKAVNPKLKNVPLFPHDLKKRHDELLKAKQRKAAKDRAKADKKYIAELVKKYSKFKKVDEVCESITEKYSFTDGEFSIVVPKGMKEILKESVALSMCIHRVENGRYFDRIERRETYILFLRKNTNLKEPWYIIEVEPNGTVQQKRTTNDSQYDDDISAFTPFLREWQKYVSSKLTKSDIELARESKRLREENFADLRKTKKQVNYGNHRGELLIDLLEKDLLEVIAG